MKPCPRCGVAGQMGLHKVLVSAPPGTYSIAGAQDKTVAVERYVLECHACTARWYGRLEGVTVNARGAVTGGHFVADMEVTK